MDALERLAALIRQASTVPKRRVRTAPSRAAREERLREKKIRGGKKKERRRAGGLPED